MELEMIMKTKLYDARDARSGDVFLRAKEGQETNVTVDYTGGCRCDA